MEIARGIEAHDEIARMVKRIAEHLNPERIILFGSYAKGTVGLDSPRVPELEVEINHLAYNLYGLTHGEIALVEKKFEISHLKSQIPKKI